MRKIVCMSALVIFVAYFAAIGLCAAPAQHSDPVKVAGDHYKVLLENEHVRVLDFTGKAGDKIVEHWHPAHVVYLVSGGKANFTVDGKTALQDMKIGDVVYMPAQNHAVELIGPGEIHAIIVELKGSSAAKPKTTK